MQYTSEYTEDTLIRIFLIVNVKMFVVENEQIKFSVSNRCKRNNPLALESKEKVWNLNRVFIL